MCPTLLWLDNVGMHKYAKVDQNITRGSRVLSIFTNCSRTDGQTDGITQRLKCTPAGRADQWLLGAVLDIPRSFDIFPSFLPIFYIKIILHQNPLKRY